MFTLKQHAWDLKTYVRRISLPKMNASQPRPEQEMPPVDPDSITVIRARYIQEASFRTNYYQKDFN